MGPMPDSPAEPRRTVVWCRPDQTSLVRRVRDLAGLNVIEAGSPEPARAGQVAADLDAERTDDLRAAIASTDAELVLIADPGEFGSGASPEDLAALVGARSRHVTIAALEPVPPTALDMTGTGWTDPQTGGRAIDAIRLVNAPRRTPALRALADARESFGAVRSMSVEVLCPAAAGSLGAALIGAIDLVLWTLGDPESVDAAYVGPGVGSALHALPGQTLRDLHGDLSAMVRVPSGRAASVLASDRAGAWSCAVTLLGEAGVIRVSPAGFVWTGPDGETTDEHACDAPAGAAAMIADQLARLLDPDGPTDAPINLPGALAVAQAALLSARTGQGESPETIQRLVARR